MRYTPVARDIFETHLPEKIKKNLDLSTLELKPGSYIDAQCNHTHSDILYGVETHDGYGYLYILAEQQRTPDKYFLLRLFTYTLRIIEDHMKQGHTHFPVVIPFIYYNGLRPYPHSMNFWDYFKNPRYAKRLMLRPVHLVDVNRMPDEPPATRWSAFLELLLKSMRQGDDFLPQFQRLCESGNLFFIYSEEGGAEYIDNMVHLTLEETEISDKKALAKSLGDVLPTLGKKVMGLLQQERTEGRFEGKLEGLEEGMEKGKLEGIEEGMEKRNEEIALNLIRIGQSLTTISKVTGLSEDSLRKL